MQKLLVVVDMQNDFIDGSLGSREARLILPAVQAKIEAALAGGSEVVFTRDTHTPLYLDTAEGKHLPVPHCIQGTHGWELAAPIAAFGGRVFDKPTFGSVELAYYIAAGHYQSVELVGVCTDICVISNAMLIKAFLPECTVSVDSACCAGVTPASHQTALKAMAQCQIQILS